MNKIVVADAGPLIAMASINQIQLISETLGKIIIPQEVAEECLVNDKLPGALAIQKAVKQNSIAIQTVTKPLKNPELLKLVDEGEGAAMTLAVDLKATLLIDEKLGRSVAKNMGLTVIGTGGMLILAKKRNIIHRVYPLIEQLTKNGYRLSHNLVDEILLLANEHHLNHPQ